MATRSQMSRKVFFLACAIAIAFFTLILIVMGVRVDRGVPSPPTADAAELARQDTAQSLLQLSDGAASLSGGEDLYHELSVAAQSYADQLGGVWVPWPDGAPEGATNPPTVTQAPRDLSAEGLTIMYEETITDLVDSLATVPETQALLYSTMLADLVSLAPPEAAPLPGEAPTADGLAEIASDSQTVRLLDVSRQYLETVAARTPEDQRERISSKAARLNDIVNAMLETGTPDTRESIADLPDWFYDDPSQLDRLEGEADRIVAEQAMFLTDQVPADRRIDLVKLALEYGWADLGR